MSIARRIAASLTVRDARRITASLTVRDDSPFRAASMTPAAILAVSGKRLPPLSGCREIDSAYRQRDVAVNDVVESMKTRPQVAAQHAWACYECVPTRQLGARSARPDAKLCTEAWLFTLLLLCGTGAAELESNCRDDSSHCTAHDSAVADSELCSIGVPSDTRLPAYQALSLDFGASSLSLCRTMHMCLCF